MKQDRPTNPRHHGQPVPSAEDYFADLETRLARLPPLVPVADVAIVLGVCRQTVYNLVESGDLAGVRLTRRGGLRLFRESVRDYLRRRLA